MTENEVTTAATWSALQAECPHCGQVQDIDEGQIDNATDCYVCEKPFIPVDK